jgi:hypothetical protein
MLAKLRSKLNEARQAGADNRGCANTHRADHAYNNAERDGSVIGHPPEIDSRDINKTAHFLSTGIDVGPERWS